MDLRLTLLRVALVLVVLPVAGGCGSRGPVAPTPPAPSSSFTEAERAFGSGDYLRADALYGRIIEDDLPERETALARRALIYALPGTEVQDRQRAVRYLDQLRAEYPSTILGTGIEAVLGVLPAIDDLERTALERSATIDALESGLADAARQRELFETFLSHASPFDAQFDLDRAREDYLRLLDAYPGSASLRASEHMLFLLSQWQRLSATGANLAETLSELTSQVQVLQQELDRLKQIDLGRRLPD
jgi:Tetratricopeptide repeat